MTDLSNEENLGEPPAPSAEVEALWDRLHEFFDTKQKEPIRFAFKDGDTRCMIELDAYGPSTAYLDGDGLTLFKRRAGTVSVNGTRHFGQPGFEPNGTMLLLGPGNEVIYRSAPILPDMITIWPPSWTAD
jgi:hypothetical protein